MLAMAAPMTAGWLLLALVSPLELTEAYWLYIGRVLTGAANARGELHQPTRGRKCFCSFFQL